MGLLFSAVRLPAKLDARRPRAAAFIRAPLDHVTFHRRDAAEHC
jgi:hypothetical protein